MFFSNAKTRKQLTNGIKHILGLKQARMGLVLNGDILMTVQKRGLTQWNLFAEKTKYFEPSTKDFMINYRVDNLEALVDELKSENVTIVDKIETYDYGKFVHILDIEGNKIQLWEPVD